MQVRFRVTTCDVYSRGSGCGDLPTRRTNERSRSRANRARRRFSSPACFDGVYRWFQVRGQAARDAHGRISRWYGLLTDIHDRKLAEDELRRRQYYLAMGERVSLTGSYPWEIATDQITRSEQLLRIHEFDDPSTVTAAAMRARIHPDDLAILESTRAEVESGRGNPEYEIRLLMPDGHSTRNSGMGVGLP